MFDVPSDQCFRFIAELMAAMKSTNQQEKVLSLCVDRIVRMYRCQTCAVVLIDPKTEYLTIDHAVGLSLTFCNAFRKTIATAAVGQMIWTGKPILILDSGRQPELAAEVRLEHPFGSCICAPIAADNRPIGYLFADHRQPEAFGEQDTQVIQVFADIAALAITKARLSEENLHLERVDRETGLDKYAPFLEKLRVGMARATEFNEPFSILLFDIDNFKTVVNTYGFKRSRDLLREIADSLKEHTRAVDAAGRFGFDEFILMLVNTDLPGAVTMAEKIVREVEARPFTTDQIRSTVSAGVASFPQNGVSAEDLLTSARRALFEAQRTGRNTVFHFEHAWYTREEA